MRLREDAASNNSGTKIGTTRRGIGPAYEDKVGRRAIRVMDLANLETLPAKIDRILTHHNALRRGLNQPEILHQTIFDELSAVAERILPFRDTVWRLLDQESKKGSRILFEGAQGHSSGHRPRHLSVCYFIQYGCRPGGSRFGIGTGIAWLYSGHYQGLYDKGRRRTFPDRTV